jgi:phage tail-like protein
MTIQDYANNPIDPSSVSFLGFATTEAPEFPHDIYSFLIESVRMFDRDHGDLLVLRFLAAPQSEFEDAYERIKSLLRLYDPELTPAAALSYVKWIVGFTSRLDFLTAGLSEYELRILISIGARMWKLKGTDAGLAYVLAAFSTYPIRVLPWFFFRTLVDEVEVGRAELNVDPWLIDQPGFSPSVRPDAVYDLTGIGLGLALDLTTLLGATEAVPHAIRVQYVPTKEVQVVESYWSGTGNGVFVEDAFGQATPSTNVDDYRVGVDPDEFVSDLRVVDDGTGTLNRALVENLVRVLRPNSERYFVRYLDFQDTFRDAFYWTVEEGSADNVVQDREAGRVALAGDLEGAVVSIATDFPNDAAWEEYQAAIQFLLRDAVAGEWFQLRFYYQDASNYFAVNVDPGTTEVKLYRVVSGTPVTLATATLGIFHPGVFYVVHVATERVTAGTLIQFFLDGNKLGEVVDPTFTEGKLAAAVAAGQRAEVSFAELFQFPLASTRIGPGG